jgi:hypothetical protein
VSKPVLMLCAGFLAVASAAFGLDRPLLEHFRPATEDKELAAAGDRWRVEVRGEALGGRARIELPDGTRIDLLRTRVVRRASDRFSWFGRVPGTAPAGMSTALFAVEGDHVAGIVLVGDGRILELVPVPGGHEVAVHDGSAPLSCEVVSAQPDVPEAFRLPLAPRRAEGRPTAGERPAQREPKGAGGYPRVPIFVAYTAEATAAAGGEVAIAAQIRRDIDFTNLVLANSAIALQVELVGLREVQYPAGSPGDHYVKLAFDQALKGEALATGARSLGLYMRSAENPCGLGDLLPRRMGLFVVNAACEFGGGSAWFTAHEIGHNLGAHHDPPAAPAPRTTGMDFARGHNSAAGQFKTLMSYGREPGGLGIPVFSNPDVAWNGFPTGIPDQRDNVRALEIGSLLLANPNPRQPTYLQGGKYAVRVAWYNQYDGSSGWATPSALSTPQSAFYSFGDPGNLELMLKVLDFGDAQKVFIGQLTDLRFAVEIEETATRKTRLYGNSPGECGGVDDAAFLPAPQAGATGAKGACVPGATALCLGGGRYEVEVRWRNPWTDASGVARATAISNVTGYFTFGDVNNVELMAKIIDFGDRVAVFYGVLSNFEYEMTVTDTATGAVRVYRNPAGNYCGGLDNTAF